MEACPTCPNRHHADTLESLAEAAQSSYLFRVFAPVLRRRAQEVREAGCNNWKTFDEEIVDRNTMQVLASKKVTECMRDRMVSWFNHVSAQAHHNGKAAESHRNVVAEGFSYLIGRPVVGDGASLPVEFREALESAGVCKRLELPGSTE